jgi:phosphatidylinositol alpha-1,6-mannosyltransferase
MKYLIVTQTYPPRTGGMQNVMNAISNKLAFLNETHVFPDHYFKSKDSSSKIFIHNNFAPKLLRPLIKKKLVSFIYENEDVVICDSWKSLNAVPSKAKKIIVLAHGQEFLSIKKKRKRIENNLKNVSSIICSSSYTSTLINDLNISKVQRIVIPPTYSLKAITNNGNDILKNTDKVFLLTICRLEERKGIIPVLKSLSEMNNDKVLKPFFWNICGEGLQADEIRKCIKDLNLSKNVKLVGKVNTQEKESFLEKSDLFIMPSYKVNNSIEGFGISYVEAAAYGVPSIAGIEGGVKDAVIDAKTGWCVDPLDGLALTDTLKSAINNKKLREKYGNNAQKKFLDYFLGEKVFRKFMDVIST